jgi:hypothetical protein
MDVYMHGLWFSGYRDEMLKKFGDIETARRFYLQHEKMLRGNGSRPSAGWWEVFGPPELRMSHPDAPDWLDLDYSERMKPIDARRIVWLEEHYPDKWNLDRMRERMNERDRP